MKFPVEWGVDYYALTSKWEEASSVCTGCGGIGKIRLRDDSIHKCPKCEGAGECKNGSSVYCVGVYRLHYISVWESEADLIFCPKGRTTVDGYMIDAKSVNFATMQLAQKLGEDAPRYLYATREEAQTEADRLNAERGKKDEHV
jgi:hypothetical protein